MGGKTPEKPQVRVSSVLGAVHLFPWLHRPGGEQRTLREWLAAHGADTIFTPEAIVAASVPWHELWFGRDQCCGIYFLQRGGKVCYIGQSTHITLRVFQHRAEGREFERVTAICDVHPQALNTLEASYISAWRPPWNNMRPNCGDPDIEPHLAAMDRALICTLPEIPPFTERELADIARRLG